MAHRATSFWKEIAANGGAVANRRFATAAESVRSDPAASSKSKYLRGELAPVYVSLGLITCSFTLGFHIAKQQLAYAPGVYVNKKQREMYPEVAKPEKVVDDAEKFVNKSLFRKVGHVQKHDREYTVPDHVTKEVFEGNLKAKPETIKSVVEPDHN